MGGTLLVIGLGLLAMSGFYALVMRIPLPPDKPMVTQWWRWIPATTVVIACLGAVTAVVGLGLMIAGD